MPYAVERLAHLLGTTQNSMALQFLFASEVQAQSELAKLHPTLEGAPANAAPDAPQPEAPATADRPQRRAQRPSEDGRPQRKVTTTQVWRSGSGNEMELLGVPARMPDTWEWDDLLWVNFQESARQLQSRQLFQQLFQLVYEQSKKLVDAVTDGGKSTPQRPAVEALTATLAEELSDITGASRLPERALERLAALDATSPLYSEKTDALCAELFLEGSARLPEGVTAEAVQELLHLFAMFARRRFDFLAPEGHLADERAARIAKEKEFKQYLLADFESRLECALCGGADEDELDEDNAAAPDFTYDEEQLAGHFRRLMDEMADCALQRARQDVKETIRHFKELDEKIGEAATNWSLMRLDRVDRALLRLSACQLLFPIRKSSDALIINEAVELAKLYGKEGSHAFINGVLDRIRLNASAAPITFGGSPDATPKDTKA